MMTTELDGKTYRTKSKVRAWTLVLTLVTCGQAIGGDDGHLPTQVINTSSSDCTRSVAGTRTAAACCPLVGPSLFPPVRRPRRLLSQAASQSVLAALPPPYYIWGPPEICYPPSNGPRDCNKPH